MCPSTSSAAVGRGGSRGRGGTFSIKGGGVALATQQKPSTDVIIRCEQQLRIVDTVCAAKRISGE